MSKILYIGFGEIMNSLKERLSPEGISEFAEIMQLRSDTPLGLLQQGDVFLIGPYALDPVRQVQRATQLDSLLSVVVLIFPEQFNKVKQQIQFSFNVGKQVVFIPWTATKDISAVLASAAMRTRQRRSFLKLQEAQVYPPSLNRELTFTNLGIFLENAPIGAIVFNHDKQVISANVRARKQFPDAFAAGLPTHWDQLFPESAQMPEPQLQDESSPVHEVLKVNNQFLEINISMLEMEKERPHYLLLINDITGKVQAENRLKSKIDELEFVNQEMDEFINVISHDFKTPLTAIGLLTELALMEGLDEKPRSFVMQIQASSNKLRELLKGMTELVDIQKPRSEKVEWVDFTERLQLLIAEYRDLLTQNAGSIQHDFSAAPGIYYFKPHLDSFLSNLVTNAIKYRHLDRNLLIEVKTRREKEYLVMSVKDNGMGIDLAKNMNKLFQPFKRLTDQGTGSGLGLSIIKRIIEKDQGYLEVYSMPGEGTEFKVFLKEQHT